MALKNCVKCGRMFAAEYDNQVVCSKCVENDDDYFKTVREYIYDHPNATVQETSEATGVAEDKILKFLRQGKLALKGDGVGLDCERCGKSIPSGRYCDQCADEMKRGFSQAFGTEKKAAAAPSAKTDKSKGSQGMFVKKR